MSILNTSFLCIIPILIGFYLNIKSSEYVHNRAKAFLVNPYSPLPDLIHSNFPKINTFIPDYFMFLCISLTLFYSSSLINIEKNVLCVGICLIIRSISICLTIMPSCMPKPSSNSNIYIKWFCSTHDLMFSGHTLFFIAIGNILSNYYIQLIGPFLLIISRQHYTIDVCVSGLVYFYIYTKLGYIIE